MGSSMRNLQEVNYYKCGLCKCGFTIDNGAEFEFISENKQIEINFLCNSCIDTIINSEKAKEWY